jgi:hypothetical protein
MFFDRLVQLGFVIGDVLVPKLMKKLGVHSRTAHGHGNLWTGIVLGAAGALLVGAAVMALTSGGAAVPPTVLGGIVIHGMLGISVTALGTGLVNAGEHALGFSSRQKMKNFFRKALKKEAIDIKKDQNPPRKSLSRAPERKSSFGLGRSLAGIFSTAASGAGKKPAYRRGFRPAIEGPRP